MKTFVVMLLMLWDNSTGVPVAVFEPLPIFTSMQNCLEVAKTAEAPPKGFSVSIQCIPVENPPINNKDTLVDE